MTQNADVCMLSLDSKIASMPCMGSEKLCLKWFIWFLMQVEVRKADSGQIIFKDNMTASIAALVKGDYKGGGTDQIIICATSGEVCCLECSS